MKTTNIENLYDQQLIPIVSELFEFIQLTYGIGQADQRMIPFFVKVLKDNYKHLNFEQIEQAYEYNSLGHLDIYLNKVGQRPDNKIRSFNVPDLTKIINAYTKCKSIEKEAEFEKKEFTQAEKNKANTDWCNWIVEIFELYRDEKEVTPIYAPMFTAQMFAKFQLLDEKDIINNPDSIELNKNTHSSKNQKLIYEVFDALILQGKNIENYLNSQKLKYKAEEMPY